MLIVGVTGSFGTGKTSVAKVFASLGAKVLNADEIAHELMKPSAVCFKPVVKHFGDDVITSGKIDRKKLARIVFNNKRALATLTSIVHPEILKELKRRIAAFKKKKNVYCVVIDAAVLIEAGWDKLVDVIIVVKANQALQIDRIKMRMRLSSCQVLKRIRAQMPIQEKVRLADLVIDNRKDFKNTKKRVKEIWKNLQIEKKEK